MSVPTLINPEDATGPLLASLPQNITRCSAGLWAGELIGLPTETVYGLAADAGQRQAVERIYRVKGRPINHPLIVHVSGKKSAQFWFAIEDHRFAEQLIDAFWPGPLTLIVRRNPNTPDFACGGQSTIGIRSPSHPVAQLVLQAFESLGGKGVAAPSANRFGRVSPTTAQHVLQDLGTECPLTLDGGESEFGIESTIIDLSRAEPEILRLGSISLEQINELLNRIDGSKLSDTRQSTQAPKVSGSLEAHYAPLTPVELVSTAALNFRAGTIAELGDSAGVLAMRERPENLRLRENLRWISAPQEASAYAHSLYANLRAMDGLSLDRLIIELPPAEPRWLAIRDRLKRSAAGAGRNL